MSRMTMADRDLINVCEYVLEHCGLCLDASKDYLIESRLGPIRERGGWSSFTELVDAARRHPTLKNEIVDAITTNETLFFRDSSPFEALRHKAIPELIDAREKSLHPTRIRIWSAACSTGQEAYSIAMTLCELIPDIHSWDINILGSDVSNAAVSQASLGVYAAREIERGLPAGLLNKYFNKDADGRWKACDQLRALCRFENRNLLKPLVGMGTFDIVFCRNVAIYFAPENRKQLFYRIASVMAEDGYLFVGSSEALTDLGEEFAPQRHCRSCFYRPNLKTSSTQFQI